MPDTPEETRAPLKKAQLFERVLTRTTVKKRDAKPAIEAALAVIGEVLADGEGVNLPPLGKIRIIKSKDLDSGAQVLTLKLRTPKNASRVGKTAE